MTSILGISAFYHDSAAVLIVDGAIVAAAQEERFTRKKADSSFPINAIQFCLERAGLEPDQVDYVGYYEKPLVKFERLLETYLAGAPRGIASFVQAMPIWLRRKLFLPRTFDRGLGRRSGQYVFCEHHEAHAASAFFPSPFAEAAILTMDGVGEWATTTLGIGDGNAISLLAEQRFPHSLGLLYSAFTYYTGFKVNSGEYKVMGLAPYGTPKFRDLILKDVIDLKADGSFRMDMTYFNYCHGLTMTSEKFHRRFGGPPRDPESRITERDVDLAASIQSVCEEIVLRQARHAHSVTRQRNLVLAGGVSLNCVANGRLLREGPFDSVWVQPASGDAGGALGVALLIWHQLLGNQRIANPSDDMQGALLGTQYESEDITTWLDELGEVYENHADSETSLLERVTQELADGKIVGWFHGRMEFGPRALGARSILGDPRNPAMQSKMNVKIKFRESFRPFAPSVLLSHAQEYFDVRSSDTSPYMLFVSDVQQHIRREPSKDDEMARRSDDLCTRVNTIRSSVPAVTHVDYSARVQTVDPRNGRYFRLLERFHERTGCPVLVNTSFNIRGEPIVENPEDAYRCFLCTDMDVLVLEDCILSKSDKSDVRSLVQTDAYRNAYELD